MEQQKEAGLSQQMIVNTQTGTYTIQKEKVDDKQYLVVPVVMMVEGVHHGSHGPLLHPIDQLGRDPESWEGMPVTIDHPQHNGEYISANTPEQRQFAVGEVRRAYVDGKKLKGFAYLEEQKLLAMSPMAHEHISQGLPLEVSIGVFTQEVEMAGEWNGEHYNAVAHNHRPDHLALLPGGVGACSWQDGCGIRVNTNKKGGKINEMKDVKLVEIDNARFGVYALQLNESLNERIQWVRDALYQNNTETVYHYVTDVYEDHIIYEREEQGKSAELYKQNYTVGTAGVEFVGDAQKVRREVKYLATNEAGTMTRRKEPVIMNTKNGGQEMSKEKSPCFIKAVDALIANELSVFSEADRDWLMEQDEARVAQLEPKLPERVEVNKEQALEVLRASLDTPEDYIALMPEDMQKLMQSGLRLHTERRDELVSQILANAAKDVWTEDELKAESTEKLEKIAKSTKGQANYSALGANTDSSDDSITPMYPLGVEIDK